MTRTLVPNKQQMNSPKNLSDILPILSLEHDAILLKQGDITVSFEVTLPELFTLSDQEYQAFYTSISSETIPILKLQSLTPCEIDIFRFSLYV